MPDVLRDVRDGVADAVRRVLDCMADVVGGVRNRVADVMKKMAQVTEKTHWYASNREPRKPTGGRGVAHKGTVVLAPPPWM
jgi:hypothetical protein